MADRRSRTLRTLAQLKAVRKRVSDDALSQALVQLRAAERREEEDRAVAVRAHDHWRAGVRGETFDITLSTLHADAFARAQDRLDAAASERAAADRAFDHRRAAATRCDGEWTVAERLAGAARRRCDRRQEERRMGEAEDRRLARGRRT